MKQYNFTDPLYNLKELSMKSDELRALQAPLKEKYKETLATV